MKLEMESIEEMISLMDADTEGKETVFIGQINEGNEPGEHHMIQISIVVSVRYEEDVVVYTEPIGSEQIVDEQHVHYESQMKLLKVLTDKVEARKTELIKLFTAKGYPVYKGVWMP